MTDRELGIVHIDTLKEVGENRSVEGLNRVTYKLENGTDIVRSKALMLLTKAIVPPEIDQVSTTGNSLERLGIGPLQSNNPDEQVSHDLVFFEKTARSVFADHADVFLAMSQKDFQSAMNAMINHPVKKDFVLYLREFAEDIEFGLERNREARNILNPIMDDFAERLHTVPAVAYIGKVQNKDDLYQIFRTSGSSHKNLAGKALFMNLTDHLPFNS